jgi:polysaccharide chain length determinant protein (PEP-CTERM system associated)
MKDFSHLDLQGYWKIFLRRIWYFIVTFLLVGSGAAVYIWRLPPSYKSTTTIMATPRFIPEDYIGPIFRENINDRMESVRQQLQSRAFLDRIAEEFQLVPNRPGVTRSMEGAANLIKGNMELGVVSNSAFTVSYYAPDPEFARAMVKRLAEAVIDLNKSSSKERAFVADQFLDEQVRQAERDMNDSEAKLAEFNKQHKAQLPDQSVGNWNVMADLQSRLAAAENGRQDALDQKKVMEGQIEEQQRLRLLIGSAFSPPTTSSTSVEKAAPGDPVLKTMEDQLAQKKAMIRDLTARYTDKWPDLDRLAREAQDLEAQIQQYKSSTAAALTPMSGNAKMDPNQAVARPPGTATDENVLPNGFFGEAELKLEMQKLDNTIARRQKEKDDIIRQIAIYQGRLNLPPDIQEELRSLTQVYESAKQRYGYLQGKKFSAELSMTVETSTKNEMFKIIDEANLPERPAKPDRSTLASMGLLAAIAAGFGMVFVREFFDPTLGSEAEAVKQLRLPVLIIVPDISNKLPKRSKKRSLRSSHAA